MLSGHFGVLVSPVGCLQGGVKAMQVFESRFRVAASLEAVSAFHFQTGILQRLTPPLMIMQVHRFDPLAEGSIGEFTMWMGPIPVRWKARHECVSRESFVDVQDAGPMKSWRHTHRFVRLNDGQTEVHDRIEYEHHSGWRGIWSRVLFPKIALRALFFWRGIATRRGVRQMQSI
jgi:ligand-binding SRPBCC domain-containing protein